MNTKSQIEVLPMSAADFTNPRKVEIHDLRLFAGALEAIACLITGKGNQQVAYNIIKHDRPYCVERDESGQWFVKDRGYSTVLKIPFSDADIQELGFANWHKSDACKFATSKGNWPILEDEFDVRFLPQAVDLIRRIADCADAKGGE